MHRDHAGSGILIALLLAWLVPAALAMPAPDDPATDATITAPEAPTDAPPDDGTAGLADWLDGFIQAQRRSERIPGAAVALVRSDGPVLLRGWGWSRTDASGRQPVDPERTLFRIGSVTKTFTWAALVDAVVRGRLDPDSDVNQWLDELQIPVRDGRPVTLNDLMSHSAGFEDRITGVLAPSPEAVPPLEQWLAREQPEQVYPPGLLPAYSNYGTALAARVLERVDGRNWATIVREDLLEPAGMDRTLVQQRIPERFIRDLAEGHHFVQGRRLETPFWTIRAAPAGAMTSTAADMARWLQLHLNEGVVDGRRVLPAATVARMQTPLRRFHPEVPPLLHGFYRMDRGGETILGHSGSLGDMVSLMALFPERDLGLFVVYNAAAERAPGELLEGLAQPARRRPAAAGRAAAGGIPPTRRALPGRVRLHPPQSFDPGEGGRTHQRGGGDQRRRRSSPDPVRGRRRPPVGRADAGSVPGARGQRTARLQPDR
ncbi:MAG: serine hydrolase [Gammaproteobacteria bacterium]|nr:serine hydrolase [Gammaproteobacteria bacterium]